MIEHEEAAKKIHPSAREFQPINRSMFSTTLIGWIFKVDQGEGMVSTSYSWVTNDLKVSSDKLDFESDAVRNLRVYSMGHARKS